MLLKRIAVLLDIEAEKPKHLEPDYVTSTTKQFQREEDKFVKWQINRDLTEENLLELNRTLFVL